QIALLAAADEPADVEVGTTEIRRRIEQLVAFAPCEQVKRLVRVERMQQFWTILLQPVLELFQRSQADVVEQVERLPRGYEFRFVVGECILSTPRPAYHHRLRRAPAPGGRGAPRHRARPGRKPPHRRCSPAIRARLDARRRDDDPIGRTTLARSPREELRRPALALQPS